MLSGDLGKWVDVVSDVLYSIVLSYGCGKLRFADIEQYFGLD